MRSDKPKLKSRGHQLVFPSIWSHGLWAGTDNPQGLQIPPPKKQRKRKQEKDKVVEQEKFGQTSSKGVYLWYQVSFYGNSYVWTELPPEWFSCKGRYKSLLDRS